MKISLDRLMTDLEQITSINHEVFNDGCTRHSYTKEDKKVREYILELCDEIGLDVTIDGVGNIRARYGKGKEKPILVGSHIDTVTNGGKYDGLLGVLSALECLKTLAEEKVEVKRPIELIIFAEEEGSNFGITMLGSQVLTGKIEVDELKEIYNSEEESAYDIIKNAGYDIDNMQEHIIKPGDIEYMVELHIEQGGVLDTKGISLGVVDKIAGTETYRVDIQGVSNHAGTTPMTLRQDPVVALASIISELRETVYNSDIDTTVMTVGKIEVLPNAVNAIANHVRFYVDIRDVEEKGIKDTSDTLKRLVEEKCGIYDVEGEITQIAESDIVDLSDVVIDVIQDVIDEEEIESIRMHSGAVHDSVMLTDITDVGMIFVPSVKGLSHCPEEFTKKEDIKIGCQVLLKTLLELASR